MRFPRPLSVIVPVRDGSATLARALTAILALALLATRSSVAAVLLAIVAAGVLIGATAIRYGSSVRFKPVALSGFLVAAFTAGFLAWVDALRGTRLVTWEPTPRPSVTRG